MKANKNNNNNQKRLDRIKRIKSIRRKAGTLKVVNNRILQAVQSIEKANSNGRMFNQRGGLSKKANLIKVIEADMDFPISLDYDETRGVPMVRYGRATQDVGEMDHRLALASEIVPTHSLEGPLLEIKRRGVNARAFHIKSMIFHFKPLIQQNVNFLASPLYFKFDLVAHNSINLRVVQPSYVEQNQSRDYAFHFPEIGQQIDSVSADTEEWVPITDQNILAQINRVIFSATIPNELVDSSVYFKSPLWIVHIKLNVEILGDEIDGEIRNLEVINESINNFINNNNNH